MLRPILILRVSPLMVTLRKFPLLPSDGHPQHCLFRIFDIVTHGDIQGLSSQLFAGLAVASEIDLAAVHCLGLGVAVGVLRLEGVLLAGYLQRHFWLLLNEVYGGFRGRDVWVEGAALQLFVFFGDFLLLVLCLFLHVVDQEEILDCVAALLDLEIAYLLGFEEGFKLLTGLFSEGVCQFAGGSEGLWPEGEFFWGWGSSLTRDSLFIEELEVLYDLYLFIWSKESALIGSNDDNRDELLQFL